jgi:hypothetical protein
MIATLRQTNAKTSVLEISKFSILIQIFFRPFVILTIISCSLTLFFHPTHNRWENADSEKIEKNVWKQNSFDECVSCHIQRNLLFSHNLSFFQKLSVNLLFWNQIKSNSIYIRKYADSIFQRGPPISI